MALDIIEIAMDRLTDHVDFEKLASEIMNIEGFTNIKILGGVSDSGRDAIQESYFISYGKITIVFQYTLQEYLPSKIDDTINKLKEAKIEFQELVIVNSHEISTERQDQMKRETRTKYGIMLNIYERKTIVNRLANFENGLFSRHFPDIENQIKIVSARKPFLTLKDENVLESSLLKSSLCFVINNDAPKARHSIVDNMIISIIMSHSDVGITVINIITEYKNSFKIALMLEQVQASLKRLSAKGLITEQTGIFKASTNAINTSESCTIRTNEATESLIADIIQQMNTITGTRMSLPQIQIIKRNAINTLVILFRLFGIEVAAQVLKQNGVANDYVNQSQDLFNNVRKDLSKEIGNLLADIISQIIRKPSKEQAEVLANWSFAYIGVQIMNLDPNLRELQITRMSNKVFILDTDFILNCIVEEDPVNTIYISLLSILRKYNCRIILPESCVAECITHAEIAHRTYYHFKEKLLAMSSDFIDETVGNIFVKGYYYARSNRTINSSISFEAYLRNYFEPKDPKHFMIDVITTHFPEGIEIINTDDLLTEELEEEPVNKLSDSMFRVMSSGVKSKYRSTDEIKNLAETDAKLFLTAIQLNSSEGVDNRVILGGTCYIITASNKYIKSSKDAGFNDIVTTRPQSLIAILDIIGGIQISAEDFIKLFDNPLLADAVEKTWNDVEKLLDSGIQLQNKSIPRLRWDIDQELHSKILALDEADKPVAGNENISPTAGDNEFTDLLKSASSRGYSSIPGLQLFLSTLENTEHKVKLKDEEIAYLKTRFEQLEKEITHFGKRRQNYLKRIASQSKINSP